MPTDSKNSKPTPFAWKNFLTYLSSFTVLVLGAGLVAAITVGMKPLEARAAATLQRGPATISIRWPQLGGGHEGTWLPKDQQENLIRLAVEAAGASPEPFSNAPLERVASILDATGWFDTTPKVIRTSDAITVDGDWHIPAAVVRVGGNDCMISWDAKLMPPIYKPGDSRLPAILSPALGAAALPSGGRDFVTPWKGEDVAASLELLQTLAGEPWFSQIAAVDAGSYSHDAILSLVTRDGSRIVWGGRPSKPRIGEVSTRQKLVYLQQLQHDFKRIDAGYPLIYVNSTRLQFDTSASAQQHQGP